MNCPCETCAAERLALHRDLAAAERDVLRINTLPKPTHPTLKPVSEETQRALDALFAAADANTKLVKKVGILENRIANYEAEDNTILVHHRKLEEENASLRAALENSRKAYEMSTLTLHGEYDRALHNATHSLKADLRDERAINKALRQDKEELIGKMAEFAMRFSAAESQVENLIEDNKVLRAAIATVGSIVKVAEQL